MNKRIGLILLLVVLAALLAPAVDARPRVVLLGSRYVNFAADHDEIAVGSVRGSFRQLRFHVLKNDIEIFDLFVVYTNGDRDRIPLKLVFNEHERSRTIDLEGHSRRLQRIIFNYRTIGSWLEGKAEVKIYGVR